ncbi:hypothetical protein LMG28138_05152 [Pararobbsia alpina]|uniref:VWFA domain-containing protein n=1 Tax=Pararobbsia alpina TaxID=621374 RepID=A0A6S7BXN1_9BURK|nr:hypothetical protein LMG28138_05152 [Pararobbsia alpina]
MDLEQELIAESGLRTPGIATGARHPDARGVAPRVGAAAPGGVVEIGAGALSLYARGFGLRDIQADYFIHANGDEENPVSIPNRAAVTAEAITLPPIGLEVDSRLLADATVAHAIGHLRYSAPGRAVGKRKPLLVAMLSLIEDVRIERLMMREYPGLRALWGRFLHASAQLHAEGLTFSALTARLSFALHDPTYGDPLHWVHKGRSLIDAIGTDLHDSNRFEEAASILASDLGQMRVRFDVHNYEIVPAYRDDNTFLWAFDDSESVTVARANDGGRQEIEEAQPDNDGNDSGTSFDTDPEDVTLYYPEWNYQNETLREDWVAVVEGAPPRSAPALAFEVPLQNVRNRPHPKWHQTISGHRLKRQMDGDELDLDAMIEHVIAHRTGHESDPRVFTRAGRQPRDTSVLVLLDLSASTERTVEGTSMSLLDCEKDAAERIIAAFDGIHHRIALHGFASNGRSAVRYVRLKEFDTPYEATHRRRLHALRPAWSTRFGAALRHAGHCLSREAGKSRTIVLVTDGEPSDIDVFDSRYLIEDARHAVDGLAMQGIHTHCISLDPEAHTAVEAIFGRTHSATIARGMQLGPVLEHVLARLAA